MPQSEYKTIKVFYGAEGLKIATVAPASAGTIRAMLDAELDPDGRSEWLLITLENGEVLFACYPMGETFEGITQSHNRGVEAWHSHKG